MTNWTAAGVLLIAGSFALACSGGDGAEGSSDGGSSSGDGTSASGGITLDSSSTDSGSTAGSSGGTSSNADASSATTGIGGNGAAGAFLDPVELCGGPCQCSNGIDDDGDGKVDGFDEECTGIADNDEGTFATGISGDNKDPKWQDCFFDGNSGAGDDGCRYHTDCLTGDLPADDPSCTVTDACVEFCSARTPNGCDCFGCCTFDTVDGPVSVQIGTNCDYENLDDEEACVRCTPTTQCGNECGECELCPGKDSLPDTCQDDTPQCDGGRQPCDADNPCPQSYWCSLGCCIIQPVE